MFEQPAGRVEKDRSRSIMILSGAAVLTVIVLIVLVTSFSRRGPRMQFAHAGAPEFDSYVQYVLINDIDKRHGERITGRYGRIKCSVQNTGDRVIEGLQVRAAAVGLSGQVYVEKIISPIPSIKDKLAANQSIDLDINLDQIPDPSLLQDMTVEVYGLRLR